MLQKTFGIYLNDHLAGSEAAVDLLKTIQTSWSEDTKLSGEATKLLDEFEGERTVLRSLMEKAEVSTSTLRQATAFLSSKVLQIKLKVEGVSNDDFPIFESLEALSIGIAGKQLLWEALYHLSIKEPLLVGPEYSLLINQAENQRIAVEKFRLAYLRKALT